MAKISKELAAFIEFMCVEIAQHDNELTRIEITEMLNAAEEEHRISGEFWGSIENRLTDCTREAYDWWEAAETKYASIGYGMAVFAFQRTHREEEADHLHPFE